MTAQINGFVTRSEAGLIKPRSISHNIAPDTGGVAIHYGGGPQSAADSDSNHQKCVDTWMAWQRYHMQTSFVDIAYTGGFCNHGYAFAGRGAGVRTGANGTNTGNYSFYAIVWIGGKGQVPTRVACDAADWWIVKLRTAGAGLEVRPHSSFKSTECPGVSLRAYTLERNNKHISPVSQASTPEPQKTSTMVQKIQTHVEVVSDGKWGPNTDSRVMFMRAFARSKVGWPSNIMFNAVESQVKMAQRVIDTPDDGVWGPNSQAAMVRWVLELQEIIRVSSDGIWGPSTDGKLLRLRRKYLANY